MSYICYFVQALQSMKQIIIHNFTRSVRTTTALVLLHPIHNGDTGV